MVKHTTRFALVVSAVSLGSRRRPPAAGQAPAATPSYTAPRTAWGDPDLRGMWLLEVGNTHMQRGAKCGDHAWLTDA